MNISAWHSTPMAGWEALFASELSSSKPVCSARCPNILRLGQASLSCKMRFLLVSSPIVVTCCYYTALRRVLFYGSNMFQICWDNFKCFSLFGRFTTPDIREFTVHQQKYGSWGSKTVVIHRRNGHVDDCQATLVLPHSKNRKISTRD
jgi:hypothetical protein